MTTTDPAAGTTYREGGVPAADSLHTGKRPPGRSAYVQDRCRCADCREACRVYENHRRRQALYGRWQPYVDAEPVRAHVRQLQAGGMGWKRIAGAAGLAPSTVWKLLYGDPTRSLAPSKRVRQETAAALLALQPDLAGGALIDATDTWHRIEGLVALGYPKLWIARQLGHTGSGLQINRHRVTVANAQAIAALADRVGDTPGHSSRARNYAKARGWLTPIQRWALQFEISEPVRLTRSQRLAEDARWLLGAGLSVDEVAGRLRVSVSYLRDVLTGVKGKAA
jgi:hypothetical protein